MKNKIILILFFIFSVSLEGVAQLDSKHWIPPLHFRDGTQIEDHYIYLSTPVTAPFVVTITDGAGNILATPTISNSSPFTYTIGNGQNPATQAFVPIDSLNKILKRKGFILSANQVFYANLRARAASQAECLTAKGRAALGTTFRVGGFPQLGDNLYRNFVVGLMATQNNTHITINGYNPGVLFAGVPYISTPSVVITLNQGECYVVSGYSNTGANLNGFIGALVQSDNPIVMSNGNLLGTIDNDSGGGGQDMGMDQSVPIEKIGKDYILIEGDGLSTDESPIVIAHSNNTAIFINGNSLPIATINAGHFFIVPNSNYQGINNKNMFIHTSQPAYMYQSLGGTNSSADIDLNFIPPVSCFLSDTIDNISFVDKIGATPYTGGIMVFTQQGATLKINGVVQGGSEPVLSVSWKTYKILGLTGNVTLTSTGSMTAAIFGYNASGAYSGYFSGFSYQPQISGNITICSGDSTTLTASGGISYLWSTGSTMPSISVAPTVTSPYSVIVTNGNGCKDTLSVTVVVSPLPTATITGTAEVCKLGTSPNVTFIGASGTAPYTFTYNINGGSNQTVTTSTGDSVTLSVPTGTVGSYVYNLVSVKDSTTQSCSQLQSGSATVKVGPLAAFYNTTICKGDSIKFLDSSSFGTVTNWTWNFGDGSALSNATNPSHFYSNAGTFNVQLKIITIHGCIDSITKSVVVHPLPQIQFDTIIVCKGDTIQFRNLSTILNSDTLQNWTWNFGDGSAIDHNQNPAHLFPSAGNYNVTLYGTSNFGCIDSLTKVITINPTFIATAGFGANTLCTGGTVVLGGNPTGTGGFPPYSYSWTPAGGLNNTTIPNPTATITSNSTYSLTITGSNGCSISDTVHITYNASGPHATAGFGNNNLCTSGSIILGGAPTASGGTGPYFYLWLPATDLSDSTSSNPTATINANANYVLIVTDSSGCKDIDSVSVLYSINGPFANAGFGNNTMCTGGNLLLGGNPTATGGTAPYSYSWIPTVGLNNSFSANPIATVTANAIYVVEVTDALGCQNLDSISILYNANGPFADAGFGSNTLCTGGIILLGGTPTATGGISPYAYHWIPGTGINNTSVANPTAAVNANTTYTVFVTDTAGCQNLDSVHINYSSTGPYADAGFGSNSICTGGTALLGGNPTATGGTSPYTYSWIPASGINNTTYANPTAVVTGNTFYTVIVADASGCQNLDSVHIVYHSSGPFAEAGFGHNSLCTGGTVLLGGAPTAMGGTAPYNYSWIPVAGLSYATIANPFATINSNAVYTVIVTDAAGCEDIDSVSLLFSSTGPYADAGLGNNALCKGTNILLGGSPSGTGGTVPYVYSWIPSSGLTNPFAANPFAVTVMSNTVYYLTVTDATGCTNLDSAVVNLLGNGLNADFTANPTTGVDPLLVQFMNQSVGYGLTYHWYFGDNGTSTDISPNHIFYNTADSAANFNITLIATDMNGCIDTATLVVIHVDQQTIVIYPNIFSPNGDGINDVFFFSLANMTLVSATILNRWGQKIYEWNDALGGWDGRTASGEEVSSGTYYFVLNAMDTHKNAFQKKGAVMLVR